MFSSSPKILDKARGARLPFSALMFFWLEAFEEAIFTLCLLGGEVPSSKLTWVSLALCLGRWGLLGSLPRSSTSLVSLALPLSPPSFSLDSPLLSLSGVQAPPSLFLDLCGNLAVKFLVQPAAFTSLRLLNFLLRPGIPLLCSRCVDFLVQLAAFTPLRLLTFLVWPVIPLLAAAMWAFWCSLRCVPPAASIVFWCGMRILSFAFAVCTYRCSLRLLPAAAFANRCNLRILQLWC